MPQASLSRFRHGTPYAQPDGARNAGEKMPSATHTFGSLMCLHVDSDSHAGDPLRVDSASLFHDVFPILLSGKPTAPSTSVGFPFTVTVIGELTAAGGLDGNRWPVSAPGTVGPRPVAELGFLCPDILTLRPLLVFLAASSSRIGCRYQGLRACRREERRVNFCHRAGLIDRVVNFTCRFEERRTGRMYGHAAIAMSLRQGAAFHEYHHGSRMRVPSGAAARLKHQQGLQHIARPLDVQLDFSFRAVALCQRGDLQRAHLTARSV